MTGVYDMDVARWHVRAMSDIPESISMMLVVCDAVFVHIYGGHPMTRPVFLCLHH